MFDVPSLKLETVGISTTIDDIVLVPLDVWR